MEQRILSIYEMIVGSKGLIVDMKLVDKNTRHRFMDLGIAPYSKITLLKKVNFNNLYIIEVDDVEICIRKKDAKNILIEI